MRIPSCICDIAVIFVFIINSRRIYGYLGLQEDFSKYLKETDPVIFSAYCRRCIVQSRNMQLLRASTRNP